MTNLSTLGPRSRTGVNAPAPATSAAGGSDPNLRVDAAHVADAGGVRPGGLTTTTSNPQLRTRWSDRAAGTLVTELVRRPLGPLPPGGVTVEMSMVPMHGSFWMSTHPDGIHPRRDEFLSGGEFTFGNGGVGRVVATNHPPSKVGIGDVVTVFGHAPCDRLDCYACGVLHRYTECDYRESHIIGHGKHGPDGTFARYVHLPPHSYEVAFRADDDAPTEQLSALSYAFLVADVRNAMTRHPDTLRNRRMLLIGAGMSGHVAAYIHTRTCPQAKVLVVDPSRQNLRSIRDVAPDAIETFELPADVADRLSTGGGGEVRSRLAAVVGRLRSAMRSHFGGRTCNLVFDSSSGNTAPLWDNADVLSPACHVIPFGFGSDHILLDKSLIQLSGLNLLMSRGVGNIRNRRETVELIKAGASEVINRCLIEPAVKLDGVEAAAEFVTAQQVPPKPLHETPLAVMYPAGLPEPPSRNPGVASDAPFARSTSTDPTRIEAMRVTPIALSDPPLLNAAGLHAPFALRIVVELVGQGGDIGLAELPGSSSTLAALNRIRETVVGRDARHIRPMLAAVDATLSAGGDVADDRGDRPWDQRARVHVHSALDVACLDLTARRDGVRVCDLIGGAVRPAIPFAGYLFFKFAGRGGHRDASPIMDAAGGPWSSVIADEAVDAVGIAAQAQAMATTFGFESFKLKAGILPPDEEVEAVLALRDHFGPDTPLRIDPNAVWSVETAIRMARRMKDVLEYYEDPVRGQAAMAEVRRRTRLVMATNMATTSFDDLTASIRLSSEDVILSDHHYWGGIRPALELSRMCQALGRGYSMHSNSHGGVSLAAMVHLAACVPELTYALDTHYPWQVDDIIEGGKLPIVGGQVTVPDGPGLGVTLDPAAMSRAEADYHACGLTDRDDQTEIRKVWSDWTFKPTRY